MTEDLRFKIEPRATSNFYLAAAFLATGAELSAVDRSDPKHIKFIFEGVDLTSVEKDWDTKALVVNAREYADAIREIKLKIHQE
jgi:hypothetical protein